MHQLAPFGIEAQSPDIFLTHLFQLDPPKMLAVLERQAAAMLRRPIGVEGILDRLTPFAPTFVQMVGGHRSS